MLMSCKPLDLLTPSAAAPERSRGLVSPAALFSSATCLVLLAMKFLPSTQTVRTHSFAQFSLSLSLSQMITCFHSEVCEPIWNLHQRCSELGLKTHPSTLLHGLISSVCFQLRDRTTMKDSHRLVSTRTVQFDWTSF